MSTATTLSPNPSSKMISVRSPLSETIRLVSVIKDSTPSTPVKETPSGSGSVVVVVVASVVVVAASLVGVVVASVVVVATPPPSPPLLQAAASRLKAVTSRPILRFIVSSLQLRRRSAARSGWRSPGLWSSPDSPSR